MMNIKQNPTVKFQKSLATLPVSLIKVDDYQRVLRESNVKKIVKNFDPVGLQHLSISYREGQYYVFDGQHRLEALKRLGIEEVECIIHYGMTYKDEAKAWDYFNKQITKATPLDEANAALKRGDALAVAIDQAVNETGIEIDYKNKGTDGSVRSYNVIKRIFKKEGKERLQKVLLLITRTLGYEKKTLTGWFIDGVNDFLNEYQHQPSFDMAWFEKTLSRKGFDSIRIETDAYKTMFGNKTKRECVVAVLVETYNKGKRRENKI